MFLLAVLSDTVRVPPPLFAQPTSDALRDRINRTYANRILPDVGLCVCLFDVLACDDGAIMHGDGCAYIRTRFRMVVFRPMLGEVMEGAIRQSSEQGLTLSVGFFEEIYVPADQLPEDTYFDTEKQVWIWEWGEEQLHFLKNERVRFRVVAEAFPEDVHAKPRDPAAEAPTATTAPPAKDAASALAIPAGASRARKVSNNMLPGVMQEVEVASGQQQPTGDEDASRFRQPLYSITATVAESGLGLVAWWQG